MGDKKGRIVKIGTISLGSKCLMIYVKRAMPCSEEYEPIKDVFAEINQHLDTWNAMFAPSLLKPANKPESIHPNWTKTHDPSSVIIETTKQPNAIHASIKKR